MISTKNYPEYFIEIISDNLINLVQNYQEQKTPFNLTLKKKFTRSVDHFEKSGLWAQVSVGGINGLIKNSQLIACWKYPSYLLGWNLRGIGTMGQWALGQISCLSLACMVGNGVPWFSKVSLFLTNGAATFARFVDWLQNNWYCLT